MKAAQTRNAFRGRSFECLGAALIILWLFTVSLLADDDSFSNQLAQAEFSQQRGDLTNAFGDFIKAEPLATNCAEFCLLTKCYCDLIPGAASLEWQKTLAKEALTCARLAVNADSQSVTAHLCVAVCLAKNFPYADNRTKVAWSKEIKTECETAIALDPKQDIAYYLLGRWHFGVANMNFVYKGLVKIIYGGLPKATNQDALKNFQKAIELAPDRIIDHWELAKVYEVMGQQKLAMAELEKCRELKPVDRDDAEAQTEAVKKLPTVN